MVIDALRAPRSEQRDNELREASADLLKWLDSKEVKSTFEQMGSLTRSHSHLAIQVSREFSEWAGKVIGRFRAALSNERNEP